MKIHTNPPPGTKDRLLWVCPVVGQMLLIKADRVFGKGKR